MSQGDNVRYLLKASLEFSNNIIKWRFSGKYEFICKHYLTQNSMND